MREYLHKDEGSDFPHFFHSKRSDFGGNGGGGGVLAPRFGKRKKGETAFSVPHTQA